MAGKEVIAIRLRARLRSIDLWLGCLANDGDLYLSAVPLQGGERVGKQAGCEEAIWYSQICHSLCTVVPPNRSLSLSYAERLELGEADTS